MSARGIRNNNPGNIRRTKPQVPWVGLKPVQTDPLFCQFETVSYGVRAMAVILKTYYERYGLTTVRQIVSRWAPPNENDTEAYVTAVAGDLGVEPDAPLTCTPRLWEGLCSAIIEHENGAEEAARIATDDIETGVDLAFAVKHTP